MRIDQPHTAPNRGAFERIFRGRVAIGLLLWLANVAAMAADPSGLPMIAVPFMPPPEPEVTPWIGTTYSNDTNGDRIDDQLLARAQQALAASLGAITQEQAAESQSNLEQFVQVELVFKQQITQPQIDAFLRADGQIDYIYRAVSYGWNGHLPLAQVSAMPAVMGENLVLLQEAKPARLHLDTATRTGRVRPIWTPGFAGSPSGFAGDPSITIAICDTGTDESHTDLNGRRVYWHDFSTDAAATPIDLIQHGSHVMGIATGTGAASGSGTGTLSFTDENSLSGVPNGSFYPSPFELPGSSVTVTLTSRWLGGGSTTLYLVYHSKGVSGGFTAQASITGTSPLTLTTTFTPVTSRAYSPALLSNGSMSDYVTTCQVANDPGVGDGFNRLRGVAPGCNWACAKVFTSAGSGVLSWTDSAIDDLVANRVANNIKVMNLSLGAVGSPGLDPTTRQKVNTAVNNGIVLAVSAGNDGGTQQVDDPGRAAMVLTVAAANDVNQLTDYTSEGFTSPGSTPGQEEDYKPDVMAPGGSASYYSAIMSVDSNSGDGSAFADQQPNDYFNIQGTSMASPFAAGCAALVIDAMQQSGVTWDFSSSQHSRYVKMVLCATASESNTNREGGANNPTLDRAAAGPNGYPVSKDQYEGYGMINPDAAVEAVSQTYTMGTVATNTLGPNPTDRRAWARTVSLAAGQAFTPTLVVPAGGDFDFYLYSVTPSAYGTPRLLTSSTLAGTGVNETFNYTSSSNTAALLVVKRVAGSGSFSLSTPSLAVAANFTGAPTNGVAPLTVTFTNLSSNATNYTWDFGDGKTSTATNAVNTYTNAGSYTVKLTAIGPNGSNSLTLANYIVVTNPPPLAGFAGAPTNGLAPLTVTFTNLSSNATNYTWDFGDGKTSTATNAVNTYTNAGSYTVKLTATGPGGTNSLTRAGYVVATNLPPLADFIGAPTNGVAPLTVTFTNLSGNATNYTWEFGDGKTSTATNAVNTYTNAGSYTVKLTAIGPGGTNSLTRAGYVVVTNLPPVADFTGAPTNGVAPLTVTFTNLSSNATNYTWDFGDGTTSTATNAVNTYTNAGSYTVKLTAIGPGGTNSLTKTGYVVVTNLPPLANFTGAPTNGVAPLTVTFTNFSSNATNYTWDFGDGTTSTATNAVNTYTNAGSYTVKLTAISPGGTNSLTRAAYVVVTNLPPLANFTGAPTNGVAPLTVTFTNFSSNATNYTWDFGDGKISSATNAVNTYTNAGSYTVKLTATGPGGTNSLTRVAYVVVTNLPPLADFIGAPTNGVAPLTITFTNLSGNATNYTWDFGDGKTSTATNAVNTYTNAGSYTVKLAAIGPGGTNSLTRVAYVVVTNLPPLADFIGAPTNGVAPLTVTFTNLSSNATNYTWDFGDGKTSTASNAVNTYTNAGSYTVKLTAIGPGGTNSLTRAVYVVVTNLPPLTDFIGAPTNGVAPLTVTFTNLSSNATNYTWDFGDGKASTATNAVNTYTNAGSYTVMLTAIGPGGANSLTRAAYVVVTNLPPLANFIGAPTNGVAPLTVTFTNFSGNATNYTWDFGDGKASTATNAVNTYTNAGSYTVMLTAIGPGGTNSLTRAAYVVVTNLPPLANFIGAPTNGVAPLTVTFTNFSGNATNYTWDFGDGKASTATNAVNTYTNAGSYTVMLTAIGPGGTNSLTKIGYVVVTNLPPLADFTGAPTNGVAPLTVTFTNLSSNATNYTWDFGDGKTSTATNAVNTYTNGGSYTVKLTAIGPGGTNSLTKTGYVVVTNLPPLANFIGAPTNGVAPLTVTFTNFSGNATNYTWDFGDGKTSTATNDVNTYTNAGSYTVKLTAIGPGGTNSLTKTGYVVVTNLPPLADFTGAPTNGVAPLTVTFTNLSSNATNYTWDFGDGKTSTATNAVNTYTNAGSYTVKLTAIGPGGTNSLTKTGYVVVTNLPPVAEFSGAPTNGVAPLTVAFTNSSLNSTSYLWDFGDGNVSTNANPMNTYTNAGSYTVQLTAVGPAGTNILALTNYIVIAFPPPVADFAGMPNNGVAPLTVTFTNLSLNATDYLWDFGDGNISTNANPVNTYTNAGSYTVQLAAFGPGGTNIMALTNYIVIAYPPPVADFVGMPTNGVAPLTVTFTNLSSNATNYTWDFGDGNVSTNANSMNTYTNAGSYTVQLTAVGPAGTNILTLTNYILVLRPALLVVTPTELNFGLVPTGATTQASLVLSNAGAVTLSGTGTISGGAFGILAGSPFTLDPAGWTNLVVQFSPVSPGWFSNLVTLASSGGDSTNLCVGRSIDSVSISAPVISGTDFIFSFQTFAGFTYQVQFKAALEEPVWQTLETVTGDGSVWSVTNSLSTAGQRFFHLQVQ